MAMAVFLLKILQMTKIGIFLSIRLISLGEVRKTQKRKPNTDQTETVTLELWGFCKIKHLPLNFIFLFYVKISPHLVVHYTSIVRPTRAVNYIRVSTSTFRNRRSLTVLYSPVHIYNLHLYKVEHLKYWMEICLIGLLRQQAKFKLL